MRVQEVRRWSRNVETSVFNREDQSVVQAYEVVRRGEVKKRVSGREREPRKKDLRVTRPGCFVSPTPDVGEKEQS